MWDYIMYLSINGTEKAILTLSSNNSMFEEVRNYIPHYFNWWLFSFGEALILIAIFLIVKRLKK